MADTPTTLRLTIADPVPGVRYSLQRDDAPHQPVTATEARLSFDVPIRLADDNRVLGPFVRREGKNRRFVYIRIGQLAGDHATALNRRAKIDIHDIAPALLDRARAGRCWRWSCRAGARTARPPAPPCARSGAGRPSERLALVIPEAPQGLSGTGSTPIQPLPDIASR